MQCCSNKACVRVATWDLCAVTAHVHEPAALHSTVYKKHGQESNPLCVSAIKQQDALAKADLGGCAGYDATHQH